MESNPEREIAIFNGALQLPIAQRAGYLAMVCSKDEALRQRIERLLEVHDKAGGFLEEVSRRPAQEPVQKGPNKTIPIAPVTSEKEGEMIGRYKVLQEIGEGGGGIVYMAQQEEPVKRRVALKVIKLGMDTRQVIARFEAERQALALMDHPNIAKVLDAGATETGRPFFVMELVRGIKITEYCDQNKLLTEERLKLFVQICHALQHAHQKGIIHRDIKPSNILVTLHDGVPIPKVIDFGIAKATTDVQLTDKTMFTRFEQFIGTPAYMSPEQAEMSGLDIDTRTDIYSLGVLLYELLTSKTPFDQKELLDAGLEQMRKTIRETEPARPSTRVGSLRGEELTTTANRRGLEAPKLISQLRGDLDWIVMKALEKDRTRRYETANGLAMDIQRHLRNEPVLARPASKLYRFQKLARRNKVAFAAAAAVFFALLAGLGVSTWMFAQERVARRQALAAEKEQVRFRKEADAARQRAEADDKRARTEAQKSQQVAAFLKAMLEGVDPSEALGQDTALLKKVLDKTSARIGTDLKTQPEVEAQLRETLGKVYFGVGEYGPSIEMLRKALNLYESISGAETTNTARVLTLLAEVLLDAKDYVGAGATARTALALNRKLFGEISPEVSTSLSDLGLVVHDQGDREGAERLWLQSIEIRNKLPESEKLIKDHQIDAADALDNYAGLLLDLGKPEQALPYHRQALELRNKWCGPDSPKTTSSLNNLALTLRQAGHLEEAEKLTRQVISVATKLWGEQHWRVPVSRKNLGIVLRRRGSFSGELAPIREALGLNPIDALTADAFSAVSAKASLKPLTQNWKPQSPNWRYTYQQPTADWAEPTFADGAWATEPAPHGMPLALPRTNRKPPPIVTTNVWLRREFEVGEVPSGRIALVISPNHDASVFINGFPAAQMIDWSDTETLVPCLETAQKALKKGRNVLAVHSQDADADLPIEVSLALPQDSSLGRKQLLEEFTVMIEKEPQRADLAAGLASALARLGRWNEAVTSLQRAIQLKPNAMAYFQLAPLLLETGDMPGYQRLRQDAVERFAEAPDPDAAEAVCKLCLLAPAQDKALAAATKLANETDKMDDRQLTLCLRQELKGLAEFRLGHFDQALEWLEKALASDVRRDLPGWNHDRERNRTATDYALQAMAHHQLKHSTEAQASLTKSLEIVQTQFPEASSGDVGREWHDWLITHVLLREAKALIGSTYARAGKEK